jgi:adenosylmethionine-8-amino-7-oxononanoate aminotransferase
MSYHGITLGALSMSGHVLRRKRFIPLLEDFPIASPPYCYRCPFNSTYPSCNMKCAKELETAIQRIGSENIAAFIAEPIIGAAGGAVTPPQGYYQEIKDICSRNDILFIADEVMTGIARTGKMFAMEHWGVEPDIICLGKGMSAGYTPIAAVLVSDFVMDPISKGSNSIMAGHTYSANPLSAAISLAVLEYIERNNLMQAAEENGLFLMHELEKLGRKYSIIGDIRGKGMLIGIEFVTDLHSKIPFPVKAGVTSRVIARAFYNGLIIYSASGGVEGEGDAIIIAPPLVITKAEIDSLVDILDQTIMEMQKELQAEGWL